MKAEDRVLPHLASRQGPAGGVASTDPALTAYGAVAAALRGDHGGTRASSSTCHRKTPSISMAAWKGKQTRIVDMAKS